MKYSIPKFVPIYKSSNKLCVGFANQTNNYAEFEYNQETYDFVLKILKYGISLSEIDSSTIAKKLSQVDLLENVLVTKDTLHRGHFFLDYLKNENLPNVMSMPILIFGSGGVGGTLTYLLAQFGFQNIHIVDFDVVNESDVLKLSVYDKSQIGKLKTEALKERIYQNFGTKIDIYDKKIIDLEPLRSLITSINPEIVIKACDPNLLFRENLNKVCYSLNIPHFHVAYSFEYLKIGPLYVPNFMGCDQCFDLKMQDFYGEHYAFRHNRRLYDDIQVHPSVSFNINIAANFVLKEVIFFLTQQIEYCFSIGRVVEFNPLSLQINNLEIDKHPSCSICNHQ